MLWGSFGHGFSSFHQEFSFEDGIGIGNGRGGVVAADPSGFTVNLLNPAAGGLSQPESARIVLRDALSKGWQANGCGPVLNQAMARDAQPLDLKRLRIVVVVGMDVGGRAAVFTRLADQNPLSNGLLYERMSANTFGVGCFPLTHALLHPFWIPSVPISAANGFWDGSGRLHFKSPGLANWLCAGNDTKECTEKTGVFW
jgi:hypothetical protein